MILCDSANLKLLVKVRIGSDPNQLNLKYFF